ncbi:MAG: hypothetical protein MN733_35710 [Nitrososphaera sp.]|nr:hypothetical protein [Nitrososphaera sp.]
MINRSTELGAYFSGLPSPTHIDAYMAFAEDVFVLIKIKPKGSVLAQQWEFEKLIDALFKGNNEAVLIIASHVANEILAEAIVAKYRYRKQWKRTKSPVSVRIFIDSFLAQWCERSFSI